MESMISPKAKIGKNAQIGPNCRIYDGVTLGDDCVLESHVVLGNSFGGEVTIGDGNRFSAFSCVGGPPQDLKYKGEKTKLIIGNENHFRECVTVNTGTVSGGGVTRIGDKNLFMAYCHVAHDDVIGNQNVLANQTQLAGHVIIEDKVTIGGLCAVNQFVRIGKNAFLGGGTMLNKDCPPFCIAMGVPGTIRATNKIGLERSGMSDEAINQVNRAIRIISRGEDTVAQALERIKLECEPTPEVKYLVEFVQKCQRGLAL